MKTSELTGPALDWAVAKCEGLKLKKFERKGPWYYAEADGVYRFIVGHTYSPSTNWAQGGPIIARERIGPDAALETFGQAFLVAALRTYVSAKLGEEVNIPAELKD